MTCNKPVSQINRLDRYLSPTHYCDWWVVTDYEDVVTSSSVCKRLDPHIPTHNNVTGNKLVSQDNRRDPLHPPTHYCGRCVATYYHAKATSWSVSVRGWTPHHQNRHNCDWCVGTDYQDMLTTWSVSVRGCTPTYPHTLS